MTMMISPTPPTTVGATGIKKWIRRIRRTSNNNEHDDGGCCCNKDAPGSMDSRKDTACTAGTNTCGTMDSHSTTSDRSLQTSSNHSSSNISRRNKSPRFHPLRKQSSRSSSRSFVVEEQQDQPPPQETASSCSTLLDQLGGMQALATIEHDFSRRVLADDDLQHFFHGAVEDPRIWMTHQKLVFAMAFSSSSSNDNEAGPAVFTSKTKSEMETSRMLRRAHEPLIKAGLLDESHFDILLQHLVDTLRDRGFVEMIVQQVVQTMAPLRCVFTNVGCPSSSSSSSLLQTEST